MCCWADSGCKAGSAGCRGLRRFSPASPCFCSLSVPFQAGAGSCGAITLTVAEGKHSPSLFHLFRFLAGLVGKCPYVLELTTT